MRSLERSVQVECPDDVLIRARCVICEHILTPSEKEHFNDLCFECFISTEEKKGV